MKLRWTSAGYVGKALAFMDCPPLDFHRLLAHLRAAAPEAEWDLVCGYDPGPAPPGVRLIRATSNPSFAFRLWCRMLLRGHRAVFVACVSADRVEPHSLFLTFVRMLPAPTRTLIDREGHRVALRKLDARAVGSLVATATLLVVARAVTWVGLKILPDSPLPVRRGGRIGLVVPIMPDLSHTFVYREVLELRRRDPGYAVVVLEEGDPSIVHREAAELSKVATVVPKMTAHGYLLMYLALWLRRPIRVAGVIRFFAPHTASFGAGSPSDDKYCLLRLEYLHHTNHLIPGLVFAEQVRRQGIAYLHTWGTTYPAVRTLVAHRLLGVPFSLSTFVDYDYATPFHMLPEKLSAARFAVVCSQYCANHLGQVFPKLAGRFVVIRHSLPADYTSGKTFRPRHGRSRVVYVGRLVEKKGLDTLITACERLTTAGVPFSCHLYGDGELKRRLQQLVEKLGLEDTVRFEPPMPNEHFYSVMNEDDVFVCPSRYLSDGERDGIPVSLMEAMAGGITVVSTPVSGIPELIVDGRNGYLVNPNDPAALADLIQRLILDRGARAAVAEEARETIRRNFSIDMAGARLHELISQESRSSPAKSERTLDRRAGVP